MTEPQAPSPATSAATSESTGVPDRLEEMAVSMEKVERAHVEALATYQESDAKYRAELQQYALDREVNKPAIALGMVLRIVAVLLLAYIAYKVS